MEIHLVRGNWISNLVEGNAMNILRNLKYTPKESLEFGAAELLESKKWRISRSLWLALVFLTFGIVSWAFLLFQGFRFRSRLARTYGFIHLALFVLYSNLNTTLSGDAFWLGLSASMLAICGIAFPLYVNRELLVCKAEKTVLGKTWISRNLPGTKLDSDSTVNRVQAEFKVAKDNLKAAIEDEKKAFSQLKNELSQLKELSESESAIQQKRVEEPLPNQVIQNAAPAVAETASSEESEKAHKTSDLRADGQARGTRRLDF
jgi:hypothetical protein